MRVGIPKEIKVHEYRVGMTPHGVSEFIAQGHRVFVEHGAGTKLALAMKPTNRLARLFAKQRLRFGKMRR